jgi:predicted regulator of Ras-like GTPase activity (Roadblock/LC7/MglB family)
MNISPDLSAEARAAVARLLELSGIVAVVVATADGFDVASAVTRGVDAARVAAMASSISAIGAVVVQEGGLAGCRHVTVGASDGFVHVASVMRDDVQLVINVIANGSAVLAQVAYGTAEQARRLAAA